MSEWAYFFYVLGMLVVWAFVPFGFWIAVAMFATGTTYTLYKESHDDEK